MTPHLQQPMHADDPNLAASIFAAATPGDWDMPRSWGCTVDGAAASWYLRAPGSGENLATITAFGECTGQRALADAILMSQARAMLAFLLGVAAGSYSSQAADLVDAVRSLLANFDRRARAMLTAPEPGAMAGNPASRDPVHTAPRAGGRAAAAGAAGRGGDCQRRPAPDRPKPDAVVVYVDGSEVVRTRICDEAEGICLIEQALAAGTSAVMHQTDNPLGMELVMELFPGMRRRVAEASVKVREDLRLVRVLDRHAIPRDRDLRMKVLLALDELRRADPAEQRI